MLLSTFYKKHRKTILIASTVVSIVGLAIIGFLAYRQIFLSSPVNVASWYDNDWEQRKAIDVSNDSGGDLTDEQVLVEMDTASLIASSKLQADCDDLRFVDSDDSTPLDYWVEGGCDTANTRIWTEVPTLPSAGKTIYVYYGNPSAINAEMAWTGDFITLSTAACPSGSTRNTSYDDRFAYGSATYGVTGGSSSHSHSNLSCTSGATTYTIGAYSESGYGQYFTLSTHTHTMSATVTSATALPPYLEMFVCNSSSLDVDTDMVYMPSSTVGTGWTRFSALDDTFAIGASSYGGTGGSTTHTHSYTGSTTSSATGTNSPSIGGTPRAGIVGTHTHTVLSGTTPSAGNLPEYVTVLYAQPDADTSDIGEVYSMVTEQPPLGWSLYSGFDFKYIMGSDTAGTTGGDSSHTHTVPIATTGSAQTASFNSEDTPFSRTIARSGHTHSCTVDTNSAANVPPYLSTIFAQRNTSQVAVLGAEERSVPNVPTMGVPTALSTTSIRWNFTDTASDETGFKIYDELNNLKVTCASPDLTYCDETGLSANTEYTRKVVSYNASGESDFSSTVSAYTLTSVPTISYGGSKTVSSIDLTGGGQVNGSELYYDCTGAGCDTGLNSWTASTSATATDLEYNTGYDFQIKSRNGDDVETAYSETINIFTLAGTPTISSNTATETTISLTAGDVRNLSAGASGVYFECVDTDCDTGIKEWINTDTDIVTSLSANTQYTFKVKTRNYDGTETAYSSEIDKYTLANVPTITAEAVSSSDIQLTADNVANLGADSSALYFECTGAGCNTGISEWTTSTTDSVTGLEPNTQYTFKVKARNGDGTETTYSDTVSVYTQSEIPTISLGTISATTVELTAGNIGTLGVGDSAIYFECTGDGCDTGLGEWITVDTDTVTTLDSNTEYTFRVKARNFDGTETAYSSPISVYTYASVPTVSGSSLSSSSINVTANGVNNLGVGDSAVYFECITEGCSEGLGEWITVSTDAVTSLAANEIYSIRVKARNADGVETAFSSSTGIYTQADIPTLTANAESSSSISLTAGNTNNINLGDSGLYFECTGESCSTGIENWIQSGTDTVTDLLPNTEYTYKVKARNYDSIETDYSSNVSKYTLAEIPAQLTLKASTDTTVTFNLGTDTNPSTTMYVIYESISGKYYSKVGQNLSDTQTWISKTDLSGDLLVGGLTAGTNYNFKIKAKNGDDIATAYTSGLSAYTRLLTPTIGIAQVNSSSAITWKFTDTNSTETGFKVYDRDGTLVVTCNQANITSCQETGLSANTTYQRKIKAYNLNTESAFTTLGVATTYSNPSTITSISTVDADTVTLSVSAGSNDLLQIYESTTSTYYNGTLQVLTASATTTAYASTLTVDGLSPDRTYSFRIRSQNMSGINTAWSEYTNILTQSQVPTISGLNKLDSDTVRVFVNARSNPSTTQYMIQEVGSGQYLDYSTNTLVTGEVWGTYTQIGGINGLLVNGLEGDGQYGFRVIARNTDRVRSGYSQAQYIGTKSIILNVPGGMSATLAEDENTDVTIESNGQLGEHDVRVKQDKYLVADIPVSFIEDRDWEDVVLEFAPQVHKTVVKLQDKHGVAGAFTMYVSKGDTDGFRICPEATTLKGVVKGCEGEVVLTGEFPQTTEVEGKNVSVSKVILGGVKYWVADGLTGTGGEGFFIEDETVVVDTVDEN